MPVESTWGFYLGGRGNTSFVGPCSSLRGNQQRLFIIHTFYKTGFKLQLNYLVNILAQEGFVIKQCPR